MTPSLTERARQDNSAPPISPAAAITAGLPRRAVITEASSSPRDRWMAFPMEDAVGASNAVTQPWACTPIASAVKAIRSPAATNATVRLRSPNSAPATSNSAIPMGTMVVMSFWMTEHSAAHTAKPAENARPAGANPSRQLNSSLASRCHHLMKTFLGWHDQQLPDGTIIWRLPDGHTYVTTPGQRAAVPLAVCAHRRPARCPDPGPGRTLRGAHRDDAAAHHHPRPKPRPPHRHRTPPQPPNPTRHPNRTTRPPHRSTTTTHHPLTVSQRFTQRRRRTAAIRRERP